MDRYNTFIPLLKKKYKYLLPPPPIFNIICVHCLSPYTRYIGTWWSGRFTIERHLCTSCGRITVNPLIKTLPKRNDKGQFVK